MEFEEREVQKMPESEWADGRLVVRRAEATDDVLGKLFSVRSMAESNRLGEVAMVYGQQVLDAIENSKKNL